MKVWTTRRQRSDLPGSRYAGSATLLYHKWHAYDVQEGRNGQPDRLLWDQKTGKLSLLNRVADLVNQSAAAPAYRSWYQGYRTAIETLGADTSLEASTVWRLVVGFATNPALETGITLHPLHGVPYIPGSAVRGLARRVAECKLAEKHAPWADELPAGELPGDEAMGQFLDKAEKLQTFLGSLAVAPSEKGQDPGWKTPIEILRGLREGLKKRSPAEREPLLGKISALLDGHKGGQVTFFDAMPLPGQSGLLETDLLNPHYPRYYRDPAKNPPSDDQDPTPVYFLGVRPAASFVFPVRVEPAAAACAGKVRCWLEQGLQVWGAGAKTTAGYGYFSLPGSKAPEKSVGETRKAQAGPAATPDKSWRQQIYEIKNHEFDAKVCALLDSLQGEERIKAAEEIRNANSSKFRDATWQRRAGVRRVLQVLEEKSEEQIVL